MQAFSPPSASAAIRWPALALSLCLGLVTAAGAATPAAVAPLPPIIETMPGSPEPSVVQQVTEDEQVRIEELRVRGETRRLTVHSKLVKGLGSYEMTPTAVSTATSRPSQRVWISLSF